MHNNKKVSKQHIGSVKTWNALPAITVIATYWSCEIQLQLLWMPHFLYEKDLELHTNCNNFILLNSQAIYKAIIINRMHSDYNWFKLYRIVLFSFVALLIQQHRRDGKNNRRAQKSQMPTIQFYSRGIECFNSKFDKTMYFQKTITVIHGLTEPKRNYLPELHNSSHNPVWVLIPYV